MEMGIFVLLLLAMGIVAYEFWAIGRPQKGDTISENVWKIRASWLGAVFVGMLFFWLAYHFVIYSGGGYGIGDAIAILLGAVTALWVRPHNVVHLDDDVEQ